MKLAKLSDNLFPTIPSFFDQFFGREWMDWTKTNFSSSNSTLPAVNIQENDSEFMIDVAAPGMKKSDFKVSYNNGRLLISFKNKEENRIKDHAFTRREFSYQSFQRSFIIDEKMVNGDKIDAKYENGILKIVLPKKDEVKPKPAREIKIS